MFEHAFVEGVGRTRRPWTVVASFAGQVVLVGVAVLIPLICTEALPRTALVGLFFAPSPPPGRSRAVETPRQDAAAKLRPRQFTGQGLLEPRRMPKRAVHIVDTEAPPAPFFGTADPGVEGGIGLPGGRLSPAIESVLGARGVPPAAEPPRGKPDPERPPRVRVGGLVRPPAPVYEPKPPYPSLARQARVEGVVRLEAVIGTDGSVKNLRLVQGHPLLAAAAIAAVREWRYTPLLLNGEPAEVIMQIDVNFTLR